MMIEQALKHLQQHAAEAVRPEFIRRPGDPEYIVHRVEGGKLSREELGAQPRELRCARLMDLVCIAAHGPHFGLIKPAFFVGPNEARLVFDTDRGYEGAVVTLDDSWEHGFIQRLLGNPDIDAAELWAALRYELRGWGASQTLVEQIGAMKKDVTQSNTSAVGRGKESLSQATLAECNSPAGLPDDIQTFNVRRYANDDCDGRWPVEFVLDPNPRLGRWTLHPQRDSVAHYVQAALIAVAWTIDKAWADQAEGRDVPPIVLGEFGTAKTAGFELVHAPADED